MTYSYAQLEGIAIAGGFSTAQAPIAAAIALSESSGNNVKQAGQPYGTTGWGLWQITPGNSESGIATDNGLLDPVSNAKAAFAKFTAAGNSWSPWTTYTSGAYKGNLQSGVAADTSFGTGSGNASPTSAVSDVFSPILKPMAQAANGLVYGTVSLVSILMMAVGAYIIFQQTSGPANAKQVNEATKVVVRTATGHKLRSVSKSQSTNRRESDNNGRDRQSAQLAKGESSRSKHGVRVTGVEPQKRQTVTGQAGQGNRSTQVMTKGSDGVYRAESKGAA